MKTTSRTLPKIISSLIVLLALNIRITCAFLYYAGYTGSLSPSGCAAVEILCYLLTLYVNLFPTLSVRKVSTLRNKILEDGTALLQIFLATTTAETVWSLAFLFLSLSGKG